MAHHERCAANEVFLGNTERVGGSMGYLSERLRTVRLGQRALCIEGKQLPNIYAPLFICRSEQPAYDAIMLERFRAQARRQS